MIVISGISLYCGSLNRGSTVTKQRITVAGVVVRLEMLDSVPTGLPPASHVDL